jgi:hypothetical protein
MTEFTRRTVVTGAAATTAALASIDVSTPAGADDLDDFVVISEALTGIAKANLGPSVDPINIKQAYLTQAMKDPAFPALLSAFRANRRRTRKEIADIILNRSGSAVRYLARDIVFAWYLGTWCKTADLATYDANPLPPGRKPAKLPKFPIPQPVLSPAAYTQGWAWRLAGAHPMGYSELRFGYWADDPPVNVPDAFIIES